LASTARLGAEISEGRSEAEYSLTELRTKERTTVQHTTGEWHQQPSTAYLTVTVTEALVLCLLLEDRGCITESVCILVPVDWMKQKCFHLTHWCCV